MINNYNRCNVYKKARLMKRTLLACIPIIGLISITAAQGKKYGYNPADYPEVLKEEHFKNATELEKLHGFIDWDYRSKASMPYSHGAAVLLSSTGTMRKTMTILSGPGKRMNGTPKISSSRLIKQTKTKTSKGCYVVNPTDFMNTVKNLSNIMPQRSAFL